jgi:hypothetical protein
VFNAMPRQRKGLFISPGGLSLLGAGWRAGLVGYAGDR